jgi:hypothetical protein
MSLKNPNQLTNLLYLQGDRLESEDRSNKTSTNLEINSQRGEDKLNLFQQLSQVKCRTPEKRTSSPFLTIS